MSANTAIEWCHHTDNIVRGCRKISAGCAHCYAESLAKINPKVLGVWGPHGARPTTPSSVWLDKMERLDRAAARAGEVHRVFINSMWDPGEGEPLPDGKEGTTGPRDGHREALAAVVEAARRFEHLRLLMLTKRPWNLAQWWNAAGGGDEHPWPERLWVGTSVEDQRAADERIPHLRRLPAPVLFLSMEPLLGAVSVAPYLGVVGWCEECDRAAPDYQCACGNSVPSQTMAQRQGVSWVIVGGESGRHARPMHPDWARSLRDQCQANGVPFFFKQWGEWAPVSSTNYGYGPHRLRRSMLADGRALMESTDASRNTVLDAGGLREWHRDCEASGRNRLGYQWMEMAGKHAAGRLLDGREWSEVPRG